MIEIDIHVKFHIKQFQITEMYLCAFKYTWVRVHNGFVLEQQMRVIYLYFIMHGHYDASLALLFPSQASSVIYCMKFISFLISCKSCQCIIFRSRFQYKLFRNAELKMTWFRFQRKMIMWTKAQKTLFKRDDDEFVKLVRYHCCFGDCVGWEMILYDNRKIRQWNTIKL